MEKFDPFTMFLISIDDGFVEYSYKVKIDVNKSIDDVYQEIRKIFRDRKRKGKLRKVNEIFGKSCLKPITM